MPEATVSFPYVRITACRTAWTVDGEARRQIDEAIVGGIREKFTEYELSPLKPLWVNSDNSVEPGGFDGLVELVWPAEADTIKVRAAVGAIIRGLKALAKSQQVPRFRICPVVSLFPFYTTD